MRENCHQKLFLWGSHFGVNTGVSWTGFPRYHHITTALFFNVGIYFKDVIYLFLERGKGKEKERERNIYVWLPLAHPQLGTWPATQACALTGNRTGDPLVRRLALNPLNHTSQGSSTSDTVIPQLRVIKLIILCQVQSIHIPFKGKKSSQETMLIKFIFM